jgi:hypothetical protein
VEKDVRMIVDVDTYDDEDDKLPEVMVVEVKLV